MDVAAGGAVLPGRNAAHQGLRQHRLDEADQSIQRAARYLALYGQMV
jgi:hypothetical protein